MIMNLEVAPKRKTVLDVTESLLVSQAVCSME
jgi:hypothetical protein